MKVSQFLPGAVAALLALGLTNCTKEQDPTTDPEAQGRIVFEVTDAPVDDPNVRGVFVTVAAIKVDGELISDFTGKQTINLMDYQNGQVKLLGAGDVAVGTHSDITLVLDYDQDATGAGPGCYVLTADNYKHPLRSSINASNEIRVGESLEVAANQTTTAVLDFDLRKAVQYQASGTSNYQFVANGDLADAIRLVNKARTGAIRGQYADFTNAAGSKVVAYAYAKGTYAPAEKTVDGATGLHFKNAVASDAVDANRNFNLSFLPAGDYELYFVSYGDQNNDGRVEARGMLHFSVMPGVNLQNIKVEAGANVQLNLNVLSLNPL